MKFASSWRLSMALAAIALLAAFATWPGSAPVARADVGSVTPEALVGSDGTTLDIDIAGATAGGDTTLTLAATGTSTFAAVACDDTADAACGAFTAGNPANWAAVNGPYTATAALTLDCDEPESVTVTATHDGDSAQTVVFCVPELNDPQVQIEKDADNDDDEEYDFDWDASNGDCLVVADDGTLELDDAGGFQLEDGDNASFWCENSVNLTVSEEDDSDFAGIDDCDEGDDGVDDITGSSIDFDISDIDDGDTVFCTFVNDEDFDPTPSAGPVTTVAIILSASQIDCGGSTLVQVVPRSSAGGPAPAGTTVSITSSLGGDFQPGNSVTSGFPISLVNFLYSAPDDVDGITTITARAGNVQATAAVQIVCDETPAPPTATPAPLRPPSAGSGGLAASSGSATAYVPAALAVAAALAVLGLTAATRRFAMASDGVAESFAQPVADSRHPRSFALLLSLAMLVVALMSRRWR